MALLSRGCFFVYHGVWPQRAADVGPGPNSSNSGPRRQEGRKADVNAGRREDSQAHGEVRDPLGASEPPRTGEWSVLTHRSRAHWTGAPELWAAPRRFPSWALRGHPQPRIPGTWGRWLREGWHVDADLLNRTSLRASFIRGNSVTFSYTRHPSVYSLLFWHDGFWVCVGDMIPHKA